MARKIYKLRDTDAGGNPVSFQHFETVLLRDEEGNVQKDVNNNPITLTYRLKADDLVEMTDERYQTLSDRFVIAEGATQEELQKNIRMRTGMLTEEEEAEMQMQESEGSENESEGGDTEDDNENDINTDDFSFLDTLSATEAIQAVKELPTKEALQAAWDYEVKHKNRKTVVDAIESRLPS